MLRLVAFLLGPALSAQPLYVGAARVDITPTKPVALMGYSNPEQRISEGIHDRLYARAIAFRSGRQRLVLVSCDLSGFQAAPILYFQKDLIAKFALSEKELVFCGTHTHSAPMVFLNRTYPHPNNFEYSEDLKSKLFDVVSQALNGLRPAQIGVGVGWSDVGMNRRLPVNGRIVMQPNPAGPVDRDVQVLKVTGAGGRPIASLFAYACHSRSLRSKNRLVSGDILGIAQQFVESATDAKTVSAAFAGASGDIDPQHVGDTFDDDPESGSQTVEQGRRLGEAVLRVLRGIPESMDSGALRTKAERIAVPGKVKDAAKSVGVNVAAIGEIAMVAMDCEALVNVGKAIKAGSPFRQTFLLTNCNGGSGYLPPADLYPEGGYEIEISGFAPEAAERVVNRTLALLRELKR